MGFNDKFEVQCTIDRNGQEEGLDCVWLDSDCGDNSTYNGFIGWGGGGYIARHVCTSDSVAGTFSSGCRIQPNTASRCVARSAVRNSYTVTEAETTTTTLSFPTPPCFSFGDVNLDGYVTEEDSDLTMKYDVGLVNLTPSQIIRADVDGNSGITAMDGLFIYEYASG